MHPSLTLRFSQGLGLLINLVEYSARNRHCLVNMETSCSFDSFCTGEGDDSLKITGQIDAVQALVQVGHVFPVPVTISRCQAVKGNQNLAIKVWQKILLFNSS